MRVQGQSLNLYTKMYLGVNIHTLLYWKKPIDLRVVEYVCVLRHICATYLSEEMLLIKRSESHIKRVIKLKKIAVEVVILASLLFLPFYLSKLL